MAGTQMVGLSATPIGTLTHCDLVTPYASIDLGQLWLRLWLVVSLHQALTWINVAFSSIAFRDIHLRTSSHEVLMNFIHNFIHSVCLKIINPS